MALLGKIEEFDPKKEDWRQYLESPSRKAWRPLGPQMTGLAMRTDSLRPEFLPYTSRINFYLVKFVVTNHILLSAFIHNRFGYQPQERTRPNTGIPK